jgi:hypothetical protein
VLQNYPELLNENSKALAIIDDFTAH